MGFLILLFIIGLPLIEIYLFIEVGEQIGALSTVVLTVLTAVLGMALVRSQGLGVARRAEASVQRGEAPLKEALDGMALLVAGFFLLIPGFFTDSIGTLLLIPLVREAIGVALLSRVLVARANSGGYKAKHRDNTVDGEFEDVTPEDPDQPPHRGNGQLPRQ
jgi:UPF0716 protein FxsA